MINEKRTFDELIFFAQLKKRPGAFLGQPSLMSLRDYLFGMDYAFSFSDQKDRLQFFHRFTAWYQKRYVDDENGYACWWNHMLYVCGNMDALAFDMFFAHFERYLQEVHNIRLPEAG